MRQQVAHGVDALAVDVGQVLDTQGRRIRLPFREGHAASLTAKDSSGTPVALLIRTNIEKLPKP
jgi:hypothetical protein